jgi:cytochrome P450
LQIKDVTVSQIQNASPDPVPGSGALTMLSLEDKDPYAFYEALRERGPLVRDEVMNAWMVLDYAQCLEIESDEARFANPYANASDLMKRIKGGDGNIALSQGDIHVRLRRFHMRLFSPKAVAAYTENQVKPILEFLIQRIERKGSADLAADYADQIPPRVIAALFGMPWQDDDLVNRILHLHEEVMTWIGRQHAAGPFTDRAIAAADELNDILLHYLRLRREKPADDFASRIWADAPEYYGELDEASALGISREIFLGGGDTTVHAIANCMYVLLTQPDVRERVTHERGAKLNTFVDEVMRVFGSVQYRFRIARNDERVGNVDVKAGEALILLHAAANRDPKRFERPERIDLDRTRSAEHLAFNKGPRFCVGAGLAKLEMSHSVELALDRLPNLRLNPDAEPPRFTSLFMRSWRPLHVLFDAKN